MPTGFYEQLARPGTFSWGHNVARVTHRPLAKGLFVKRATAILICQLTLSTNSKQSALLISKHSMKQTANNKSRQCYVHRIRLTINETPVMKDWTLPDVRNKLISMHFRCREFTQLIKERLTPKTSTASLFLARHSFWDAVFDLSEYLLTLTFSGGPWELSLSRSYGSTLLRNEIINHCINWQVWYWKLVV